MVLKHFNVIIEFNEMYWMIPRLSHFQNIPDNYLYFILFTTYKENNLIIT